MNEGSIEGKLPSGWAWARLGELGRLAGGGTPSKSNREFWTNGTIPWVSPKDMKSGMVGDVPDQITEEALANSATKLIPEGSLLMVTRSGILNHTFPVAISDRPVAVNQDIKSLTAQKGISALYLKRFLESQNGKIVEQLVKDGTTVASIDIDRLLSLPIPVAPSTEQMRIVTKLDELFGEIEAGAQELERAREGLAAYRRAVLRAAVVGELTRDWREANPPNETADDALRNISGRSPRAKGNRGVASDSGRLLDMPALPTGWTWTELDQLTDFFGNGLSKPPHAQPPGEPILRISAVRPFAVNVQDRRYYRESLANNTDMRASFGDLLFTRYNGSKHLVGVCGLMRSKEPILYPDKIMRARPLLAKPWFAEYLEIALNCGLSRRFIERNIKTTAGQQGISGSSIRSCPLPLPPLPELRRIVEIVRSKLGDAEQLDKAAADAATSAASARQSILRAGFAGRLLPQNASDEPASELLNRLAAERSKFRTGGRKQSSGAGSARHNTGSERIPT